MEGETEGLVDVLTALAIVEEARLEILDDRGKDTAGAVGNNGAVRAGGTADEAAYL